MRDRLTTDYDQIACECKLPIDDEDGPQTVRLPKRPSNDVSGIGIARLQPMSPRTDKSNAHTPRSYSKRSSGRCAVAGGRGARGTARGTRYYCPTADVGERGEDQTSPRPAVLDRRQLERSSGSSRGRRSPAYPVARQAAPRTCWQQESSTQRHTIGFATIIRREATLDSLLDELPTPMRPRHCRGEYPRRHAPVAYHTQTRQGCASRLRCDDDTNCICNPQSCSSTSRDEIRDHRRR